MEQILKLPPQWQVVSFNWGSAIKKANGRWVTVFIKGAPGENPQQINLDNIPAILDEDGIHFI